VREIFLIGLPACFVDKTGGCLLHENVAGTHTKAMINYQLDVACLQEKYRGKRDIPSFVAQLYPAFEQYKNPSQDKNEIVWN
jgi:hypothetical protein